mmetsp:Transcript_5263/g.20498  ORF Transcript_5263/g.20498 Transcript_5263/m.20498 type:complete len:282 (+) Transcript_5263:2238-3083(+)
MNVGFATLTIAATTNAPNGDNSVRIASVGVRGVLKSPNAPRRPSRSPSRPRRRRAGALTNARSSNTSLCAFAYASSSRSRSYARVAIEILDECPERCGGARPFARVCVSRAARLALPARLGGGATRVARAVRIVARASTRAPTRAGASARPSHPSRSRFPARGLSPVCRSSASGDGVPDPISAREKAEAARKALQGALGNKRDVLSKFDGGGKGGGPLDWFFGGGGGDDDECDEEDEESECGKKKEKEEEKKEEEEEKEEEAEKQEEEEEEEDADAEEEEE